MRKLMHRLHRWLSLPFGVVLLVMCLTGALLSFERELSPQQTPNAVAAGPMTEHRSEAKPESAGHVREGHSESAGLVKDGHSESADHAKVQKHGGKRKRTPFFLGVFKLHRWLMIDSPKEVTFSWGRTLTGASTIAFIVILASGLWMWWPIAKSRGFLGSLRIRTGKGSFPLLFSLHLTSGVVTAIFLLTMAITGLYWTFSLGGIGIDKHLILALHTGTWGGMPMRIIYCLSAINGAFLVISGYWLWWRKRKRV